MCMCSNFMLVNIINFVKLFPLRDRHNAPAPGFSKDLFFVLLRFCVCLLVLCIAVVLMVDFFINAEV